MHEYPPSNPLSDHTVILYEVYSRRDPYEGEHVKDVLRAVSDTNIRKRPLPPKTMPEKMKSIMADCVQEQAKQRPTFEELDLCMKRMDAESAGQTSRKTKSHVSLFDIFPRHVAEALRDGRKVEAEHKDVVTMYVKPKSVEVVIVVLASNPSLSK